MITQTFSLNAEDYLIQKLFSASKSERIKKKRKKSWIFSTSGAFCLGVLFYITGNKFAEYECFVAGLIFLLFYPAYERWYYKDHYKKFIKNNYKNRIGVETKIEFNEDYIFMQDETGESKLNLTAIVAFYETQDYVFITIKSGEIIILPKVRIDTSFVEKIIQIAIDNHINIIKNLNWHWK